jgi:hypothetical protein
MGVDASVGKYHHRIFPALLHLFGEEYICVELVGIVPERVHESGLAARLIILGRAGEADLVDIGHVAQLLIEEDVVDQLFNLVEIVPVILLRLDGIGTQDCEEEDTD